MVVSQTSTTNAAPRGIIHKPGAAIRLSDLVTPEGELVHREIDGQPDDIRFLVNAAMQIIEAVSEGQKWGGCVFRRSSEAL